jgi:hypothetical protein
MTLPSLCIERPVMTTLLTRTRPALSDAALNAIEGINQPRANAIATALRNALPPCAKSELLNE